MPPDAGGREIGAQAAARHITVRACLPPRVEKEGKMRSAQIEIEGIGAARAVEKLVQGGVPVLRAKLQKKASSSRWTPNTAKKFLQFYAVRAIM